MSRYDAWTAWTFKTANFTVALEITPEEMNPADLEWFCARVVVYGPDDEELGSDTLGGCAYKTIKEFYTGHRDKNPMNRNCSIMRAKKGNNISICHYFPSMVLGAVHEARENMARRKDLYAKHSN